MTTDTEALLAARWAQTIRPEDRPPGKRRVALIPRTGALRGLSQKQAYAAECTPIHDGDEEIIALWAEGKIVEEIAIIMRMSEAKVRRRLISCHPTAVRLA
jgi:hypothetical protein